MKNFLRTKLAVACVGVATLFGAAHTESARASYPERPIQLVVPFAAGATTSGIAQIITEKLHTELGQPLVLEYKSGAGGNIGAEYVARATPDGYTLLLGTISISTFNPALYHNLTYDPVKDLQPLSMLVTTQNVVVVDPALPIHTLQDLIDYATEHPGEITFGSSGAGASLHLTGELLKNRTGIDMVHVPYRGGGPARADLLGGHISMMFSDLTAVPLVHSEKLRAIAVTGSQRHHALPDVPTMEESGMDDFVVELWYGLFAPAGTPEPIVEQLSAAVGNVLAMPDVQEKLKELGTTTVTDSSVAYLEKAIEEDTERWGSLIRSANIRLD